jgi:hypothetical protein
MNTTKYKHMVSTGWRYLASGAAVFGAAICLSIFGTATALAEMPNACPVDGCDVKITSVARAGQELEVTFTSNFKPDVSKNHFHMWWGENFTVEQVGRNAEPVFGVKQGRWHRHADYPVYITQGAASTTVRGNAVTLCVSAADRNHNILDTAIYHCINAADQL